MCKIEIAGILSGSDISSTFISMDPTAFGIIFTYLSVTWSSAILESFSLTEKYPDPWFIWNIWGFAFPWK